MSVIPPLKQREAPYEGSAAAFADATGDATGVAHDASLDVTSLPSPLANRLTEAGIAPYPGGSTGTTRLSDDQFARVAKALSDPRRFSILEIIAAHGEIACQLLCGELPVKQATVSHHVKELALAGLVETRRDGQFVYYRYMPTVMRQYLATLATRLGGPGRSGQ
jgi:ArsR family transcriptional regulator